MVVLSRTGGVARGPSDFGAGETDSSVVPVGLDSCLDFAARGSLFTALSGLASAGSAGETERFFPTLLTGLTEPSGRGKSTRGPSAFPVLQGDETAHSLKEVDAGNEVAPTDGAPLRPLPCVHAQPN